MFPRCDVFSYFSDLPIVSLQFGTILKPDSIKEGDDIYFECIVEARPTSSHIDWFINVSIISSYKYYIKNLYSQTVMLITGLNNQGLYCIPYDLFCRLAKGLSAFIYFYF